MAPPAGFTCCCGCPVIDGGCPDPDYVRGSMARRRECGEMIGARVSPPITTGHSPIEVIRINKNPLADPSLGRCSLRLGNTGHPIIKTIQSKGGHPSLIQFWWMSKIGRIGGCPGLAAAFRIGGGFQSIRRCPIGGCPLFGSNGNWKPF
mgnify:CR=1 FL=1